MAKKPLISNAARDWWEEDAERLNALARLARAKNKTIRVNPTREVPRLRADGSLDTSEPHWEPIKETQDG